MIDVTDQKQASEALRLSQVRLELADRIAGLGMYEWELPTGAITVSDSLGPLFGLPEGSRMPTAESFLATVYPQDRKRFSCVIDQGLRAGGEAAAEFRVVWPDGSLHWLLNRFKVFRNEAGTAVRMLGKVLDVTVQKRAEEVLHRDRKTLESRVKQRTAALSQAVESLNAENRARRQLEREREKLLKQVTEGRARSQALARSLLKTQETERHNLSRDLHDEIGQSLTALKVNLQGIQGQQPAAFPSAALDESVTVIGQMIESVRSLALNLRPSLLNDLGLIPALRWHLRRQTDRVNWKATFTARNTRARYADEVQITCFRIAQEALTNVARHAKATSVTMRLSEKKNLLELVVRDNGAGFNPAHARTKAKKGTGLGLIGMEERARLINGQITIASRRGGGTTVRASFPLAPSVKTEGRRGRR